jgi:hypothetical protein
LAPRAREASRRWLILVIESLVAAPVWTLAHSLPGQEEGLVTGRSGQGYMLIVNILMRPPLMVAAFFLSFAILSVVTPIVASTLKLFLFGLMGSNAENSFLIPSIPRFLMSIILVAVVMTVVIHKAFQLVTVLPDRVIRWVGGHAESLGEAEAEQKTRAAVLGVSRQAGSLAGRQKVPGTGGKGEGDGDDEVKKAKASKEDLPGESPGKNPYSNV